MWPWHIKVMIIIWISGAGCKSFQEWGWRLVDLKKEKKLVVDEVPTMWGSVGKGVNIPGGRQLFWWRGSDEAWRHTHGLMQWQCWNGRWTEGFSTPSPLCCCSCYRPWKGVECNPIQLPSASPQLPYLVTPSSVYLFSAWAWRGVPTKWTQSLIPVHTSSVIIFFNSSSVPSFTFTVKSYFKLKLDN